MARAVPGLESGLPQPPLYPGHAPVTPRPESAPPPRELLILRHAKSSWGPASPPDKERPLDPRGTRDASWMGEFLAARELVPDLMVVSPALRARRTASRVREGIGDEELPRVICDPLYGAGLNTLVRILSECPDDAARVILVGHNPGLEMLVRFLAKEDASRGDGGKFFPTCTLAHLRMPRDWSKLTDRCAELVEIVRPREWRE